MAMCASSEAGKLIEYIAGPNEHLPTYQIVDSNLFLLVAFHRMRAKAEKEAAGL